MNNIMDFLNSLFSVGKQQQNQNSMLKYSSPTSMEHPFFQDWLKANNVQDYNQQSDYDYLGAFRAGQGRQNGGHFMDTFKLPWHESFSDESKYYKPGMSAVHWTGDNTNVPAMTEKKSSRKKK